MDQGRVTRNQISGDPSLDLSISIESYNTILVTPIYNVTSIKLISAKIPGFSGAYVKLKISIGDDFISQKVISKDNDCHYFGKLILRGDLWDNSTDEVSVSTSFKSVDTIHVSFEYPDGTPFEPMEGTWILKCKLCGTIDKMCLTKNDYVEKYKRPKPVNLRETIAQQDPVILLAIAFLVIGLIMLMFKNRTGPKGTLS
jgi:hypothetical protein